MSAELQKRYAALGTSLGADPPAAQRRGFGSKALKTNDKIFAMLVRGRLVVKLPAARVAALVASGKGEPFEPQRGRRMKEWLVIDPVAEKRWLALAREAREFVAAQAR